MVVSPEDITTGRFLPPQMVQDLRTVAAVEITQIDELTQCLQQESGILSEEKVETLTRRFFDDQTADAVGRTIQNIRSEDRQKILTLVERWRQGSEEAKEMLPDSVFAALRKNLDALLQDYPGLSLMRKAQRLLRETGNEIEDLIFVCDLRPVFDQTHEHIEGFVALANLRVRYTEQGGQRGSFELALTEEELSTLVEHGQKALGKLRVLKETAHGLIQ